MKPGDLICDRRFDGLQIVGVIGEVTGDYVTGWMVTTDQDGKFMGIQERTMLLRDVTLLTDAAIAEEAQIGA